MDNSMGPHTIVIGDEVVSYEYDADMAYDLWIEGKRLGLRHHYPLLSITAQGGHAIGSPTGIVVATKLPPGEWCGMDYLLKILLDILQVTPNRQSQNGKFCSFLYTFF